MIKHLQTPANYSDYLLAIYASLAAACTALFVLVIFDVRLNTLGEPFADHLMAISIAISRLVYGVEGLAGLESVLKVLNEIPNVSSINLNGIAQTEHYQLAINEAIQKATLIPQVDRASVHGYVNDISYLYFVILALFLFGMKIQSLSYLWLSLLFVSIFLFIGAFRGRIEKLLLLWSLLISILFIVVANPGVGNQLITVHNYRFIPILGLVPMLHLILSIDDKVNRLSKWLFASMQALIFVFVLLARGSAQWMVVAVLISMLYVGLGGYFKLRGIPARYVMRGGLVSLIFPIIFIFTAFSLAKFSTAKFLHPEYKEELWARSHVVWHAAVIGLTTDPVLMERTICSSQPLTDQLKGFSQIQCQSTPLRYPRLVYGILNPPHDMFGFQAAIRYLRSRGSDEQIGSELKRPDYFNIHWEMYDKVMKKVYFEMLIQSPIDAVYMYTLVKPLRYIKESMMYFTYFWKGISKARSSVAVLGMLCAIFALHIYLLHGYRGLLCRLRALGEDCRVLSARPFWIIVLSSLLPSILFYSQAHTIADSVTVFLALGFVLQFSWNGRTGRQLKIVN